MCRRIRVGFLAGLAVLGMLLGGTMAQAGVIGQWTFDGDNIQDASGNNYHGTLNGGVYSTDVPTALAGGKSLDLTGGDNYAMIDSAGAEQPFDLGSSITVSTWVKGVPDGNWEPYLSKNGEQNGWQVRRHGGDQRPDWTTRGAGASNGDFPATINLNDGAWHHLATTYDGLAKRFYIDGTLNVSQFAPGSITDSSDRLLFGAGERNGTLQAYSRTQLDDITIFDESLAPNQIVHLNTGGDPSSLPAPDVLPPPELPANAAMLAGQHGPGGTWNFYYLMDSNATWDQHRVAAESLTYRGATGHLVTIADAAENSTVRGLVRGDTFVGLTDSEATSSIDGFDFSTLGTIEAGNTSGAGPAQPNSGQIFIGDRGYGFAWITGEAYNFQNWAGGEPNNSGEEDIAQIRTDGSWNDHNGGGTLVGSGQSDHRSTAVYEFEVNLDAGEAAFQGTGQIDPLTGYHYGRNDMPLTWDQARVVAEQHAIDGVTGHLATISDLGENEMVRYAGGQADKWIGATDSDQTSVIDGVTLGGTEKGNTSGNPYPPGGDRGDGWVWVTGEPMDYRNWGGGEPNDGGNQEDAAHIRGDGMWNDLNAGGTIGQNNDTRPSVIEYETTMPFSLDYLERKADTSQPIGTIDSLNEAKMLLTAASNDPSILTEASAEVYAVSFQDPQQGGGQDWVLRRPFLTDTSAADDDFAVMVTGEVYIPEAGEWTFAVSHDDHFSLEVGDNFHASSGCCGNPTMINGTDVFTFDEEGLYDLELIWYERGGGAFLQLFGAKGDLGSFDQSLFRLVGDTHNGGLALGYVPPAAVPEPSTFAMASIFGLLMLGFVTRRRRVHPGVPSSVSPND